MMNFGQLILLIVFFYGCTDSTTSPEPTDYEHIISIDMIGEVTVSELQQYWSNPIANNFISHDLDVMRLIYHSDNEIQKASGAILIPRTDEIKGVISLQHATFFADEEAPSENGDFSVVSRKSIFAAHGYIVVLPDYYGYGIDKDAIHPYHHAATLESASSDMLDAALEYLDQQSIQFNEKIFLAGYSEGAYATAALQQHIESTGRWDIAASSLGAGAYNILESVNSFIDVADLDDDCLPCNAFFLQAYDAQYNLNRDMSSYFKEPYATAIEGGLLLGTFTGAEVNSSFPPNPDEFYSTAFLENYPTDTELKVAFEENSIQDWEIGSPTMIMHGQEDNVVPYFNSVQLYERNENNDQVIFRELESPDHFQGIFEWGLITMDYFDRF